MHTVTTQLLKVALCSRMGIHVEIHRRSNNHTALGRQITRQQKVVRNAARHLGQRVGRRGGYDHAIGPLAQRHVRIPLPVLGIEKLHKNGMLGQRGHRQRRDELLGQRRHNHTHLGSRRHK